MSKRKLELNLKIAEVECNWILVCVLSFCFCS